MVPCAELQEVADWAARNPGADLGLHLTLTSEVSDRSLGAGGSERRAVPSLLDAQGYLHPGPREALGRIDVK